MRRKEIHRSLNAFFSGDFLNKSKIIALFLIFILVAGIIPFASANKFQLNYDENGNLENYNGLYYEYNGFNQLSKIRENGPSGNIIAEYFYDADGRRIKKITYDENNNSEITTYVGDNFIRVKNASGSFDSIYYYDESGLVANKDTNGNKFFYHLDHLGSPEIITNSSGALVEENTYLPFGSQLEGGAERYQFTGQEKDSETGLQLHGQRYYNPELMKFTQPDSILPDIYDPQQLNRYEYARNSPQKYIDPSGNVAFVVPLIIWGVNAYFAYKSFKAFHKNPSAKNALFFALDITPLGFAGKAPKFALKAAKQLNKLDNIGDITRLGKNELVKTVGVIDKKLDTIESSFRNIKFNNLNEKTLQAARLENNGQVVARKASGEPFDHVTKVRQAQDRLVRNIEKLKDVLSNNQLSSAMKDRARTLLGENSRLLDFSEDFLPRRSI